MNKIDPVPKRKTILAWTLVLVFAFICIGAALFAENSQIGASSEKNPFGPSLRINTSEGSSSQTAPVTDGVCATKPNSTQCSKCTSTLSTINNEMTTSYGSGISTTSAGSAISEIDELSDSGNMSPTDADNYITQIKQVCEESDETDTEGDSCQEADTQLSSLSTDTTVPSDTQTKLKALLDSSKSPEEISTFLKSYSEDYAYYVSEPDKIELSEKLSSVADLYDECAASAETATGTCEEATTLASSELYPGQTTDLATINSGDSEAISALSKRLKTDAQSVGTTSEYGQFYTSLSSKVAGCAEEVNPCNQAAELAASELYPGQNGDIATINSGNKSNISALAQEISAASESVGADSEYGQFYSELSSKISECADTATTSATETKTGTGTTLSSDYTKYFKWMMIAQLVNAIISGDWETALSSAAALGLGSDNVTRYAYMLQAANNDPQALFAYVMSDTLDGGGIDYSDLDQIGSTGSNQWYNQNYLQRRATDMANDLFKIDAVTSILSSVGDLISNFMGDDEAAEFQEKWDGSLESLQEIMTTITTLNYSDIAGLTNSSLYDDYSWLNWLSGGYTNTYSSQYPYSTSGTGAGTSSTTGYATSAPVTDALLSSLSATNNSFSILIRQPLSSLEYSIQKLTGSIFPTSRGIFFLSQYNTLYELIQNSEYGTAVWQLIK